VAESFGSELVEKARAMAKAKKKHKIMAKRKECHLIEK